MSPRQWLWLCVWLLPFFIIFCAWNKLQELNDTKTITKPTTTTTKVETAKTAVKHQQERKDINIKVLKDKDSIKISGIFNKKEDLEALKSEYKKISKDVKEGMIIIDKNAQNEKILKLLPTLNSEFSKFKSGFLEYKAGEMTMSGRVDDVQIKQRLHNKLLGAGNIKIDNQLIVEKIKVKKAEAKVEAKQEVKNIEKTPPKPLEPKKVVEKEPIIKKVSKKEIQAKLDNLFKLSKVEFAYAKDTLTAKGKSSINKVYDVLNEHKEVKVEIGGHTDSDGTKQDNKTLSQKRADAIRKYLIAKGIKGYRLIAVGYGESQPLVKNSSLENKQINRRVEFKIIGD